MVARLHVAVLLVQHVRTIVAQITSAHIFILSISAPSQRPHPTHEHCVVH